MLKLPEPVSQSLGRRLRHLGVTVTQSELLTNDEPLAALPTGRVIVMTPEKLSFLLHRDAQQVLDAFDLFVFDEVHNIGGGSRGWLLESLITFLHSATAQTHHRLVLRSAAIGNKIHFIHWLELDGHDPYSNLDNVHEEWRGPDGSPRFTGHGRRRLPASGQCVARPRCGVHKPCAATCPPHCSDGSTKIW